jgi:lysozyme
VLKEKDMVSLMKKGIVTTCALASTALISYSANAAEQPNAQKGTMGYGYKHYLSQHPEKNTQSKVKTEAGTTQQGERVLDISEWQGDLTADQVKKLKDNYDFIIIRAQYGSERIDTSLEHNSALLDKYDLPFGVYSYSMYENPDDARYEAQTLYNRAPKASFFINDYEENTVTSGSIDDSTNAWYDEMKGLAGNKKVLLYSYQNFMEENLTNTVSTYDGFWLANYSETQPSREYALWQYTDQYHSPELDQDVDANYTSPDKDTNWFIS